MCLISDLYKTMVEEKSCKNCKHGGGYEPWGNGLIYEGETCGWCENKNEWEMKEVESND